MRPGNRSLPSDHDCCRGVASVLSGNVGRYGKRASDREMATVTGLRCGLRGHMIAFMTLERWAQSHEGDRFQELGTGSGGETLSISPLCLIPLSGIGRRCFDISIRAPAEVGGSINRGQSERRVNVQSRRERSRSFQFDHWQCRHDPAGRPNGQFHPRSKGQDFDPLVWIESPGEPIEPCMPCPESWEAKGLSVGLGAAAWGILIVAASVSRPAS